MHSFILHGFSFRQLQRSDPGLSLHFRGRSDVESLGAPVRYDKRTGVDSVNQSAMQ